MKTRKLFPIGHGHSKNLTLIGMSIALFGASEALADLPLTGSFTGRLPGKFETLAYDPAAQLAFLQTTFGASAPISVVNLSNPANPTLVMDITTGRPITNVTARNGVVAATALAENGAPTDGEVVLFDYAGNPLRRITVGNHPDSLAFSPDGQTIVITNEGERSLDVNDVDTTPGSISIIRLTEAGPAGVAGAVTTQIDFSAFNTPAQIAALKSQHVFFDQGYNAYTGLPRPATFANDPTADWEPENVAFTADGSTAYITVQEANLVAKVNLATNGVTLQPFGAKDHGLVGNEVTFNERSATGASNTGAILTTFPGVKALYQPDGIATFVSGGNTYYVIANEGDSAGDEQQIRNLPVDSIDPAFPSLAALSNGTSRTDRLRINSHLGIDETSGKYTELFTYGGRSISVRDANGNLIWDSGNDIEEYLIANPLGSDVLANFDQSRSGTRGPEPEGIALGEIDGKRYVFTTLERASAVMAFDITDPANGFVAGFFDLQDFPHEFPISALKSEPEGIVFVSAADSPSGLPLLLVANEAGEYLSIITIPEPATLSLLAVGTAGLLRRRRTMLPKS